MTELADVRDLVEECAAIERSTTELRQVRQDPEDHPARQPTPDYVARNHWIEKLRVDMETRSADDVTELLSTVLEVLVDKRVDELRAVELRAWKEANQ
jgi:hypothetical protein